MTRRPSPEALRDAARLAREEGVTVRVMRQGDAWVYDFAPDRANVQATDKDEAQCDEAFGL